MSREYSIDVTKELVRFFHNCPLFQLGKILVIFLLLSSFRLREICHEITLLFLRPGARGGDLPFRIHTFFDFISEFAAANTFSKGVMLEGYAFVFRLICVSAW